MSTSIILKKKPYGCAKKLAGWVRAKETIHDLFKRPDRKEVAVSIHAEAVVMGAAYSDVKDADFRRSKIHIGVPRSGASAAGCSARS
ncbi:hypothetical protein C8Q74DRAFT_1367159 [Fomes fomentarius]|nr:hypothetical protein C8Q74DRAFT_1367159 [Fomes fomentarius]